MPTERLKTISYQSGINGFTEGSVVFIGADGKAAEDNAQLFWDDANDFMGLGTSSPSAKFHQDGGNATASYHKFTAGTTTGQTSSDGFDVGIASDGDAEIRQRENGNIDFFTNDSNMIRFDSAGRILVGDLTQTYAPPFFFSDATKVSTGIFIDTIDNVLSAGNINYSYVEPTDDVANGAFSVSLYTAGGSWLDLAGQYSYQGVPVDNNAFVGLVSGAGNFGSVAYKATTGTCDVAVGAYYRGEHSGYGGALTTLIGGAFFGQSSDLDALGTPTGSLTNCYGGVFGASNAGGVSTTNGASAVFYQPYGYDPGTGVTGSITNRTAIDCRGTVALTEGTVASAASITAMANETAVIRLTGTTATTIHGIAANSYNKVLWIINQTGANLTIAHQSGTEGTAANRIITATGASQATTGNGAVMLYYSSALSRWILLNLQA